MCSIRSNPRKEETSSFKDSAAEESELLDSTANPTDKEAEVGIIEKISLSNFMCHSHLNFEFGPNINFVIGHNGSGKSSILTGLVVGLGGRANVTSRGSSLKDFIKLGESSAFIEVCLRNKGEEAFKQDEYGPMICVERKLNRDGSSSYKIKSHNNKVISTKKTELLSILDHLNIQIDNPVSVLNQNTSRNFLNSKSATDKYKFFMKATLLDQMKESNADAAEKKQLAEDMLARKRETLPQLKREVEEWENRWNILKCMQEQKDKISDLKREWAWALVSEKEDETKKLQETYQVQDKASEKISVRIQKCKDCLKEKLEDQTNLKNKVKAVAEEIKQLQPEKEQIRYQLNEVKTLIWSKEMEKRRCVTEISNAKEEEVALEKQIEDVRKTDVQDFTAEREQRQLQITMLESQKAEKKAQQKTTNLHSTQLRGSVSHFKEQLQNVTQEIRGTESQIATVNRHLRDLEGNRSNRFGRFGRDIPALIENIEKAWKQKKFLKKPIGPIGAYLALNDPNWAVAVEQCLGLILEAFCCDNHQDEKVLWQLINSTVRGGRKPSIIVSTFQGSLYNVSRFAAKYPPHSSVLDMLIIKDPVIGNCLVDQKNVESILLIANKAEARHVMTNVVPKNCVHTFTIEGDQVFPVPSFRYYTNQFNFSKYLQGSVDDKINENREQVKSLQSQLQASKSNATELENRLKANQQELRRSESHEQRIYEEIGQITTQINNLLNFAEPEPVDVSSLEQEVIAAREAQEKLELQLQTIKESVLDARNKYESLLQKHRDIDSNMQDKIGETEPLKEQLEAVHKEVEKYENEQKHFENKLKTHLSAVAALKQNWETTKAEAESMAEKTEAACARIRTRRLPNSIKLEIAEIEKSLKREEKLQGNKEEVKQRFIETKTKYNKIRMDIKACEDILKKIEEGVKNRQDNFVKFRSELAVRLKYFFNISLSLRKYKGSIKFDHSTGTLTLEVQTNDSVKQMCNDMRSLSGGERSFSTVCFIIALWDMMDSPFRILDEFDVFMDSVNRRISLDMMMENARTKRNIQFILLTPQNMTKLRYKNMVKICRIGDPQRGVTQEEVDYEDDDN